MKTIQKCKDLVKEIYEQFDASHDWQHIERVWKNAMEILQDEPEADKYTVQLAVLLHDVSDPKYSGNEGKKKEEEVLNTLELSDSQKVQIKSIIQSVSFNGGNEQEARTIEEKIVRDADRLDAIGAIGIARTFAYGGAKGRKLYDLEEEARTSMTEEEYRSKETASVTHFYEKLLLLKDLMTTRKGKQLAEERHSFMVSFLQQLMKEVNGTI